MAEEDGANLRFVYYRIVLKKKVVSNGHSGPRGTHYRYHVKYGRHRPLQTSHFERLMIFFESGKLREYVH
jgi:hypothetical protein